jgi:protein gp37
MSDNTKIPWADASLNFATGCTKISAGCANCYAMDRTIPRLQACGQKKYANGTKFTVHQEAMYAPLKWRKPKRIFVNSVSDTFHDEMPESVLIRFFEEVVAQTPQHTYLILTKRVANMVRFFAQHPEFLMPNVWIGVTAENQQEANARLKLLEQIKHRIRFVSVEPMLGPVDLSAYAEWLDWVIIGCESGPKRRHIPPNLIADLIIQCKAMGVSVFLKQAEIRLGKIPGIPFSLTHPPSSPATPQQYLEYPEAQHGRV